MIKSWCAAAEMVSGFLKSTSHNLRYVGIDSLARVVRINAKYAAEHQLAVIDCLEDPDDTLKKKTLELLYKMTKPSNVEVSLSVHYSLKRVAKRLVDENGSLQGGKVVSDRQHKGLVMAKCLPCFFTHCSGMTCVCMRSSNAYRDIPDWLHGCANR